MSIVRWLRHIRENRDTLVAKATVKTAGVLLKCAAKELVVTTTLSRREMKLKREYPRIDVAH
jgi:hypothetical protein